MYLSSVSAQPRWFAVALGTVNAMASLKRRVSPSPSHGSLMSAPGLPPVNCEPQAQPPGDGVFADANGAQPPLPVPVNAGAFAANDMDVFWWAGDIVH